MKFLKIAFFLALPFIAHSQRLKYKSDIEPLLKVAPSADQIPNLQTYYEQGLGSDGNPTTETLNYQRERMTAICYRIAFIYKDFAFSNKDYPTTDTAIGALHKSVYWYTVTVDKLYNKDDTLSNHIAALNEMKVKWNVQKQETIRKIQQQKEVFTRNMNEINKLNEDKATELRKKYPSLNFLKEYEVANKEASEVLKQLQDEKRALEEKMKEAQQKKEEIKKQMESENKQKEFLRLQKLCEEENPCPACPLEVAKEFRDAYFAGDIAKMKTMIVDYYGDEKLFYNKEVNLYKELPPEEVKKYSLRFRGLTQDYKKTDPENVVYYTDNETKDFYIDKHYKSYYLHATVFSAINEYDKIDLIKYNGQWKVYRVGGAYGGRTGKTICNGSFFYDERFLQKEVKLKKKK